MKVSVILTSYNRPVSVREAVASVQAQTYSYWELFIVDDNSNEETKAVLNEIAESEPRCTIINSEVKEEDRPKTARYATCINLAIPKLTGDFVTYLTDDDIYYPERFARMVEAFNNPDVHVVYGQQRIVLLEHGKITHLYDRGQPGITRSPSCQIDHNSVMHRHSCFNLVNEWLDVHTVWAASDAFFFTALAEHYDFHPVNFLTDEHRMHPDSIQARLARGEDPWLSS